MLSETTAQVALPPKLIPVFEHALPRPSTITGAQYTEISTAYYSTVHDILTGQNDAQNALDDLEIRLRDILGEGFTIGTPAPISH